MIAIPNIDMPKECVECFYGLRCKVVPRWLTADFTISSDCPLIDIVTCGECKYSKIYALQSDTPMSRWCHKGHFPKEVTDGYYCGDGERRTDE